MAVYFKIAFVSAAAHHSGYLPYHPHNSQHMIGMGMGNKHVMDFIHRDLCFFHTAQNPVSASGIHKKIFLSVLNGKAGIIAFRYHSISCTKHYQIPFHLLCSFYLL